MQDKIRVELETLRKRSEEVQIERNQRYRIAKSVRHSSLMEGQAVSDELSGLLEQWADGQMDLADVRTKLNTRYKR